MTVRMWFYFITSLCLLNLISCASDTAKQATTENLTAATYNVQLGLGYLQEKDMPRAKQKLLLALKQAPKWPVAYDAMAYYLDSTGEIKQAESYYRQALRLDPNSGASLNNYGTFLCKQKKYDEAVSYFLKAANQINYLNTAEAYENAGLCALKAPNSKLAYQYFDKAIQQDPNRTVSLFELAKLSYSNAHYDEALKYIKKYHELASPNASSLWLGIQIAHSTKQFGLLKLYANILKLHFSKTKEFNLFIHSQRTLWN